jgi:hypothetical protein
MRALLLLGALCLSACCSPEPSPGPAPESSSRARLPTYEEEREAAAVAPVNITDKQGTHWTVFAYELDEFIQSGKYNIAIDELQPNSKGIPINRYGSLAYLKAAEAEQLLLDGRVAAWTNNISPERRRFEEKERKRLRGEAP